MSESFMGICAVDANGDPISDEVARQMFRQRYNQEPAKIHRLNIIHVGPIPDPDRAAPTPAGQLQQGKLL